MDFEQGAMSIFEAEGLSHKGPFLLDEKKIVQKSGKYYTCICLLVC